MELPLPSPIVSYHPVHDKPIQIAIFAALAAGPNQPASPWSRTFLSVVDRASGAPSSCPPIADRRTEDNPNLRCKSLPERLPAVHLLSLVTLFFPGPSSLKQLV